MNSLSAKYFRILVLLFGLLLALNVLNVPRGLACNLEELDSSRLKERIEFAVKWSFLTLLETYMETYKVAGAIKPSLYRLTHQAGSNAFWNDRMESIINSHSLLPCRTETIIREGEDHRKESIVFDREMGRARYEGETTLSTVTITPRSMDPLSAFYYLRKMLSPNTPDLELQGIAGSGHFTLWGRLVDEETIKVPAGTFKTYRLECVMQYWPQGNQAERKDNTFTLWVSQDEHQYPVQIRYRLMLGSLWVKAISVQSYDL